MRFAILTIFPSIFESFLRTSLIHKAIRSQCISVELINIRDFASPPHYKVDDSPYGGGPGMVMTPDPLFKAHESARLKLSKALTIYLSPKGEQLNQDKAFHFSNKYEEIIIICGRYEGIDQRFIDTCVDLELSLGPYVLMGGEVAAMATIEAVSRLLPGVIGNAESLENESHSSGFIEHPQYTRPSNFKGLSVPEPLLSGDHELIKKWRQDNSPKVNEKVKT